MGEMQSQVADVAQSVGFQIRAKKLSSIMPYAAQIGVEFARTKFGSGKGKAHIFLVGSLTIMI